MIEGGALPQSLEAERAVLGGLMLDPDQCLVIAETLKPDDFHREAHGNLFGLMVGMAEASQPTEMVAVIERVVATGVVEDVGGLSYVQGLGDNIPSTQNLEYYAEIVEQRAIARRLIEGVQQIEEQARTGGADLDELLDFAEKTVFEVTQQGAKQDWEQLSSVVDRSFLEIQNRSQAGLGEVTGIPTGFLDLDKLLAGLHKTDLLILAARPSMGKTALALNIALNAAHTGAGVGVFSLEMGREQLATRLLCSQGRVNASAVRTGRLNKDRDWPRLTEAADVLYNLPLHIDDTPGLTITQIRSKARRLKQRNPDLGLICVDYIGLMGTTDPRASRERQVALCSMGLKNLAKELDVCVLALSQLNRGVEMRDNKRPRLSDLRESGAIEQDADTIMFIYRDEYYNPETTAEPGVAELIVGKQRNGLTGTVKLAFQGEFLRFENLARDISGGGYV
jgi:replicative DNA helicase